MYLGFGNLAEGYLKTGRNRGEETDTRGLMYLGLGTLGGGIRCGHITENVFLKNGRIGEDRYSQIKYLGEKGIQRARITKNNIGT